jgi:hypothetical protein
MKTKMFTLLTLALAGSWLAGTDTARAQDRKPAPEEKTAPANPFPGDNMPVKRSDISPLPMPTPSQQGGMVDPKTGKYILYNDSRTGLGYDFEKQEITDYRTGKVYKFSEHPAYKGPKKAPKKSI